MKVLPVLLLVVALVSCDQLTNKVVNQCINENVVIACPQNKDQTTKTACQTALDYFQTHFTANTDCQEVKKELDTDNEKAFDTIKGNKCISAAKPTGNDSIFVNYIYTPISNCIQYGTPYATSDVKYQKNVKDVLGCFVSKCDVSVCDGEVTCKNARKDWDNQYIASDNCKPARGQWQAIYTKQQADGETYPFPNDTEQYPFSQRSCNVTLGAGQLNDKTFNELQNCRIQCAVPATSTKSANILMISSFAVISVLALIF